MVRRSQTKVTFFPEANKVTLVTNLMDLKDEIHEDSFPAPPDLSTIYQDPAQDEEEESFYEDIDIIKVDHTTGDVTPDRRPEMVENEKGKMKPKDEIENKTGEEMESSEGGKNEEEVQEDESKDDEHSACEQEIYLQVEKGYSESHKESNNDDDAADANDDIYMDVIREEEPEIGLKGHREFSDKGVPNESWYWGDVERTKVEETLNEFFDQEGTYVVRESKKGGPVNPYAISTVHNKEIFHVLIRRRDDGKLAVGKEKFGEKKFASLRQLIEFYQNNELTLHDVQGNVLGVLQLAESPEKNF